ncbi:hypothetical protein C7974DRAFT_184359 [Boeremia exigua]|uniref:uncharacterized protein n=1 Tax=Boeremia exigua TaxID=749465 RepID=UPI001E8D0D6E|nr:uncharacterized protein C7974DRAFT_184359 [Boeremia exigua]KAH6629298.1 hypothetical protein C7974DRAFT_184359 [Boeremia exigua]
MSPVIQMLSHPQHLLRNPAADVFARCSTALKESAPWAIVAAIFHWLTSTIQAILHGALVAATIVLAALLLSATARTLLKLHRLHQPVRQQRALRAQRQGLAAENRARCVAAARREQTYQAVLEREREIQRQQAAQQARHRAAAQELQRQRQHAAQQARHRAAADHLAYMQWRARTEALLSARETMTRFPAPPFWPCARACRPLGALGACPHSLERLYRAAGGSFEELLKAEKRRWHPDRFERCPVAGREGIKEMAQGMFVLVQGLLGE